MLAPSAFALPLLIIAAVGGAEISPCEAAQSAFRNVVSALMDATHDYEQCVRNSNGRDDCSTVFSDLDVAQERFEAVVADLRKCR